MQRSIIAIITALTLVSLFASCAAPPRGEQTTYLPRSEPTRMATAASPTPAPVRHGVELRFALVGEPTDINVWALYGEQGASYPNLALRNDYWPKLFYLAPPGLTFTPRAARAAAAPVVQEGDFFTSTVALRSDLKWTDGLPFTAEDVAFTANAVLHFDLGFDWKAFYPSAYLARAEAIDAYTVKFYFKQKPHAGVWQYGVLQGPVVQKRFWEPRVGGVLGLLPEASLPGTIENALSRIAEYQPVVVSLSERAYILHAEGKYDRQLDRELKRKQGDLDEAQNDLDRALAEYERELEIAHRALFALDGRGEPTLGAWMPAEKLGEQWVNIANPGFPFERPNFERAVYRAFADETSAFTALESGEVNAVLSPNGISHELIMRAVEEHPELGWAANPSRTARFLVINPASSALADPNIRLVLFCAVTPVPLRISQGKNLRSFVPAGNDYWLEPADQDPCVEFYANPDKVVDVLKAAGYTWQKEPLGGSAGEGLTLPDGAPFPALRLLSLSEEKDPQRARAAHYVEQTARGLGLPVSTQWGSEDDIRYAVFSSGAYDLAILGWRLSLYPEYLCEWFGAGGQFALNGSRVGSECEALAAESELETARQHIFEIQSILAQELPFVPLYTGLTYDVYQNVGYPFESVLGGLSSLYGAPSFAIPAP